MSIILDRSNLMHCAELIQYSKRTVVLSGAGVSTASGIPDFRSENSGLWLISDPYKVASFSTFSHQPDDFFNWLLPLAKKIQQAQPNPAHLALAVLQSKNLVSTVITQNIDGLHTLAGNQDVLELHGNLRKWVCPRDHQVLDQEELFIQFCTTGIPPLCPTCHKILKPGIVLFEEALPVQVWENSLACVNEAELMIVVGSSLSVGPANVLPAMAAKNKTGLIILNNACTPMDSFAEIVIHENVEIILPVLNQLLGV